MATLGMMEAASFTEQDRLLTGTEDSVSCREGNCSLSIVWILPARSLGRGWALCKNVCGKETPYKGDVLLVLNFKTWSV